MNGIRNMILSLKDKPGVLKAIKGVELVALAAVILMFFIEFTFSNPLGHALSNLINDIAIIIAILAGCTLDYVQYERLRPVVIVGCLAIIALIVI